MQSDRLIWLKKLFAEICDLPADARASKLSALTDDAQLIQEVLELALAGDAHTSRATKASAGAQPVAALLQQAAGPELTTGDILGAWRLQEEIGHGGMGTVFLAERIDGHFQQSAAIKLLHGLPTAQALEFLAKERQILATLAHPNIARLLDGGATPQGRPYLVMEHIEGVPIDAYCREATLSQDNIVSLFLQVCEGVSFAHQRLVVHCDLKPSNVMVDRAGRPVLLDFGIARLLDSAGARAEQTSYGYTPGYSSPEQRDGGNITTASDVYSLGMMLDKLLAASPKLTPKRLRQYFMRRENAATGQHAAQISVELRAIIHKASAADARQRYLSVQQLQDDLLRWQRNALVRAMPQTTAYFLTKLWQRRWPALAAAAVFLATVAGFTWRVVNERDLTNVARLDAVQERDNAKLAQADAVQQRDRAAGAERAALAERNRALVAEQAALASRDHALNAERVAMNAEARARSSEAIARTEAATAREVSDFMVAIFGNADPENYLRKGAGVGAGVGTVVGASVNASSAASASKGESAPTVAELVKIGGERVERDLKNQPATQVAMFTALAMVFENMGQPKLSLPLYERALQVERGITPPRPRQLAQLLRRFSRMKSNVADYRDAESMARESVELNERYDLPAGREMGNSLIALSLALSGVGKFDEAEPLLQRGIALVKNAPPAVGSQTSRAFTEDKTSWLQELGQLYARAGQFTKAEPYFRQAIEARRVALGERHPRTLNSLQSLALTLAPQKKLAEAETILRDVVAARREIHGDESVKVETSIGELAGVLQDRGKYVESLALYRETLTLSERLSGKTTSYAINLNNIGTLLEDMGDESAAESAYRESLAIRMTLMQADDLRIARVRHNLGRLLTRQDKTSQLAEAKVLLDQAIAVRQKFSSTKITEMLDTQMVLAEWHRRSGNMAEAAMRLDNVQPSIALANSNRQLQYQRLRALLAADSGNAVSVRAAVEELKKYEAAMIVNYGQDHPRALLAVLDRIGILKRDVGDSAEDSKRNAALLANTVMGHLTPLLPPQSAYLIRLKQLSDSVEVAANRSLNTVSNVGAGAVAQAQVKAE